ncbi:MAG: type II secretion system protein GspG, partial [Nitrospinota bacterium]|nr:type II secretion system protein GspG [Nitrospinota bacterium]
LALAFVAATASLAYLKLSEDPEAALVAAKNRERALTDLRRLGKALQGYAQKRGSWPQTLEGLVPEFVSALPMDPWNRPYVYSRLDGRCSLASYGRDGRPGKHPWFDMETVDYYINVERDEIR